MNSRLIHKFVCASAVCIATCGLAFASGHIKSDNGRIVLAQSYCGMCADSATSCRLACNGAGACIQACDEKLRDCREQACRPRDR